MRFNGIFAIEKPSGITSAQFLSRVQEIFTKSKVFQDDIIEMRTHKMASVKQATGLKPSKKKFNNIKVKMGHGGTLDPLASGVMVVGVGLGTKQLSNYLTGCTKTYEADALLGISTTTGDCEGEVIGKTAVNHITKEDVLNVPAKFVGHLKQTPPIFAALKMNGKPLYEYAREGIPLPQAIKPRDVQVYTLSILEQNLLSLDHDYETLQSQVGEDGISLEHKLKNNPTLNDDILYFSTEFMEKAKNENIPSTVEKPILLAETETHEKLPMIKLVSSVSSGTYIRSLISDIGKALRSSAYMVKLTRSQQAQWKLGKNVFTIDDFKSRNETIWSEALKRVFESNGDINLSEIWQELEAAYAEAIEQVRVMEEQAQEQEPENQNHAEEQGITEQSKNQEEVEIPQETEDKTLPVEQEKN